MVSFYFQIGFRLFLLLFSSFSKKLESDSKSLTGLPNIPLLTAVLTHWPFLLANVSFKSL